MPRLKLVLRFVSGRHALSAGKQQERHRGPELGDGEQQAGGDRERRGGADADGSLQHQNEYSFPHADPARGEEGEKAGQVRGGEHRDRRQQVQAGGGQEAAREQPERAAVAHPGDRVGHDPERHRSDRRPHRAAVGRARGAAAGRTSAGQNSSARRPTEPASEERTSPVVGTGIGGTQRAPSGEPDHRGAGADRQQLEDDRGAGRGTCPDAGALGHHGHAGHRPDLSREILAEAGHGPDPGRGPGVEPAAPRAAASAARPRSAART